MRLFVVLLLVMSGFAVCVADAGAAKPEKSRVTIAVGGKAALYYLPLSLAEQLGYFRDEGLEVEILDFPGGSKALQAMMGGSADVVSGGYDHTIVMQARGGLTHDDVSIIGVGTGQSAVAAMHAGHLDALANVEPSISMLVRSGKGGQ